MSLRSNINSTNISIYSFTLANDDGILCVGEENGVVVSLILRLYNKDYEFEINPLSTELTYCKL